jgi:hypothetical protein
LPFDQFQAMDVSFYRTIAPAHGDSGLDRLVIPQQAIAKCFHLWQSSSGSILNPGLKSGRIFVAQD